MSSTAVLDPHPATLDESKTESESLTNPDPTPAPNASPEETTATAPPNEPAAHDEEREDPTESAGTDNILEREHPSFERATISLVLQLLPEGHHPDGRTVLLGIKSHNLPPRTHTLRLNELGPLPPALTTILTEWKETLPDALAQRTAARTAAQAKAKEEAEARKIKLQAEKAKKRDETRSKRTVNQSTSPAGPPATPKPQQAVATPPASATQTPLF